MRPLRRGKEPPVARRAEPGALLEPSRFSRGDGPRARRRRASAARSGIPDARRPARRAALPCGGRGCGTDTRRSGRSGPERAAPPRAFAAPDRAPSSRTGFRRRPGRRGTPPPSPAPVPELASQMTDELGVDLDCDELPVSRHVTQDLPRQHARAGSQLHDHASLRHLAEAEHAASQEARARDDGPDLLGVSEEALEELERLRGRRSASASLQRHLDPLTPRARAGPKSPHPARRARTPVVSSDSLPVNLTETSGRTAPGLRGAELRQSPQQAG